MQKPYYLHIFKILKAKATGKIRSVKRPGASCIKQETACRNAVIRITAKQRNPPI